MTAEITDISRLRKVIDRIDPNELIRVGIFPLASEADSDDELRQYIDQAREPAVPQPAPATGDKNAEWRAFQQWFMNCTEDCDRDSAWTVWQASAAHRREDQLDAERYRMLRDGIEGWYVGPDYEVDESGSVRGYHHYYGEHLDVVLDRIKRTAAPAHGEPGALEQGDAP